MSYQTDEMEMRLDRLETRLGELTKVITWMFVRLDRSQPAPKEIREILESEN